MGLEQLLDVMEKLRSKEGCPWDREQTHESIKPYLIEETYEVLETIDEKNMDKLKEELGDLLLQVVFHAQMAKESGYFTMDDVIESICHKMIIRHPHVFGDVTVEDSAEVLVNWEAIKATEANMQDRVSGLDGVPKGLPALMQAYKLQKKAARVGFDWTEVQGAWEKVKEEVMELSTEIKGGNKRETENEFGDLLFALVNVARFYKVQPELALLGTCDKFVSRFHYIEEMAKKQGKVLSQMSLAEMDQLWDEAKKKEIHSDIV